MVRALLALLLVACVACSDPPEVREFRGSYPEYASPSGVVREFALTAAPAEIPLLDGAPLAVWAYDGQVPGPTLRVRLGDTVRVAFTNRLPQPTTVHWHGVRVPNAMDGVPGVTQDPVRPGESFVYEFTPPDAGTFWFHPHLRSAEQMERGLYGVLVVDDPEPPPWSRDLVWVLDDWLLTSAREIDPRFVTRRDLAHDGRWGNVVTVNGRTNETLELRPGERVRLRLVNVANGRVFRLDWGGLDVRVVAVDGSYTGRPLDPSGFELAPGNRLDLDIAVPAEDRGRRFAVVDRFTRREIPVATVAVADEPAAAAPPAFPSPAAAHVPSWQSALAMPPASELRLDARLGGPYGVEWTINGQAMRHDDPAPAPSSGPARTSPAAGSHEHEGLEWPRGAFRKVRFTNVSYRLHPMHVHGMFFKVLARNGVPVEEPYFRDTMLVHAQETVDVGLVPIDPGRWMLHCHVLEHAESGMMTLVEVR
jgi:FtsP/CotA-like multicopper oxidase with cupredoxin domain